MINSLDESQYIDFLKEMLLIRKFEEKAAYLYGLKKIRGFCHLYIIQEAISVGSIRAINLKRDYIITTYRDHGHAISSGIPIGNIFSELYGKKNGCSKGKGGSMHLFDIHRHMYGGHAIVGSHIPLAIGMAFKLKYMKEDGIVICYFGEGAIQMGTFHESLNLSKIWNLPILYICENNQYAMGTPFKNITSVQDLKIKLDSYNIDYAKINGMDVKAVYKSVLEYSNQVRNGNPVFLEMETYRYKGHSMSDPDRYREKEEISKYKTLDPILILKNELFSKNKLNEKEYEDLEEDIQNQIENAANFAENSSDPDLEDAYTDIYVEDLNGINN